MQREAAQRELTAGNLLSAKTHVSTLTGRRARRDFEEVLPGYGEANVVHRAPLELYRHSPSHAVEELQHTHKRAMQATKSSKDGKNARMNKKQCMKEDQIAGKREESATGATGDAYGCEVHACGCLQWPLTSSLRCKFLSSTTPVPNCTSS